MENFNSYRVFRRNHNKPNPEGEYVLYWMQSNRRFQYNFALEYAVGWANKLNKPLLVLEAFSCDYPWATERTHFFALQGMKEHLETARRAGLNYLSFAEEKPGQYEKLLVSLAEKASVLVTDEYPVFIMHTRNAKYSKSIPIPYITVDSNGLIPFGLTEKAPYSAYHFRKVVQKYFIEAYTHPPKENPLNDLANRNKINLAGMFSEVLPDCIQPENIDIREFVSGLKINHDVKPLMLHGGREAALDTLGKFIQNNLFEYNEKRNHPDERKTSNLSPWLHFGKISEFEVVREVLKSQPEGWDLDRICYNNGSKEGFFNGNLNIDAFLDEVITWREVGFHFAYHRPDYDRYESLPEWAFQTLEKHKYDPRQWVYDYDELVNSKTHDQVWNAAQTQLREEGVIHNYLRMLWGKKVLEWTSDPKTAVHYLINLNNTYAIDGRDPNSYSGIFWCFGRFDRPWLERPVFGKIRYMSSDSASKKLKLTQYLNRYGSQ